MGDTGSAMEQVGRIGVGMTVLEKICSYLSDQSIEFKQVHHQPTFTSEESARARGESIKIGGKALLIKVDQKFILAVLSAERSLDSSAFLKLIKAKKSRFATKEELLEMTGLVPGCVPPFGKPIFEYELIVDRSIKENNEIAFNAGSLTDSIIMKVDDYLKVSQPNQIALISK
jgi:Ala-tRNA(Pro) deacylase